MGTQKETGNGDGLPAVYESLSLLYSASSIGLIITERDGTIIAINKTIRDLLGIPSDKPMPGNASALYADPADRERLFRLLGAYGTVRDFEVQVKHVSGALRTVLANVDSIDWDGRRVLLTSLFDITLYKQRHQKAEKSYEQLFSNVPVGITVTDFQGNTLVANNAARDLLGYNRAEMQALDIHDFYVIPADRDQLLSMTKKMGYVRDFETVLRHRDGHEVTVLVNTDVIEFEHRRDILLTSIRDISEYKRVEDELICERDFSSTILNVAAILIVVLNKEGKITRFNRACEMISGYAFQEVEGKPLWEIPFFDSAIAQEEIDRLLTRGYPGVYDTVVVSKAGKRHTVSWTFATMPGHGEQVEFIVATGIDITEQRKAEAELQRANRELASRVEELQEMTKEMTQLAEMGEQLQSCRTVEEVCAISGQYVQRICPYSRGALYLINEESSVAQAAAMWGEPPYTQTEFDPLACWAIRRGHQHLVEPRHPGLLCEHVTGPRDGLYLCVPLTVNGRAIGILHLNHAAEPGGETPDAKTFQYEGHRAQIVSTLAEHIALALSNLMLRETLRQQSIRDPLTGLYNRRYMEEALQRELKRAQREKKPVAVIMFDIDHFKAFNDTAGHDAGDALLHELGALLAGTTRGGDIVCRYGGEEFLAVLPGADIGDAMQHAEKLRGEAAALTVHHRGKALPNCTISLGVAVYPESAAQAGELLKAADNALYRAKEEGRNRVAQA